MTQTQQTINTNFIKEWQPFDKINKKVKRAILRHFQANRYYWQPTHDKSSQRLFIPSSIQYIEDTLGLAYTSTSDYAALWVCNGGYLWADDAHSFIGFAVNELGQVVAVADDKDENSIYILL